VIDPYTPPQAGGSGPNWKIAILFGAVIALLAFSVYQFIQVDKLQTDLARLRTSTAAELASLKESSSVTTASHRRTLETLREELEAARRQATMAVGQAKTEAVKRAEQLAARLEAEQQKQSEQLSTQISEVKETASAATSSVGEVKSEVGTMKTDFAATKADLDKTIAQLKQVTGDLGVMSGLVATNGKELAALKQLGDRNYFDFDLKKSKRPQRIGDVSVLLKKTDPKKNKYTVELVADDKKVEKKDKNVNEPVQFYVSRARQPYELVVNEVRKDQIVGYLATPKVQVSR
jgi:NAD+--asparagine ADP-ribosyltransferase